MIVYLDSSVLARAYLVDEDGHAEAAALMDDPQLALVTGTWTRVEVSGALVRAARLGRGDQKGLLELLDADLAESGPVTVVRAAEEDVVEQALLLVRRHAIRALDAYHVATALLTLPTLSEPDEPTAFASRDDAQSRVATALGLRTL